MRSATLFLLISVLSLSATIAQAAEKALVIRAGDLKATPFLDATSATKVVSNQPVMILKRQGGWVQVDAGGKIGWLRMLNVRMAQSVVASGSGPALGAQPPRSNSLSSRSSLLQTGSTGKTVTTGIKGLDEENIRNASVDFAQVAALAALAVEPSQAAANAKAIGLKENALEYLQKGRKN
jgi:hypothetical protein